MANGVYLRLDQAFGLRPPNEIEKQGHTDADQGQSCDEIAVFFPLIAFHLVAGKLSDHSEHRNSP